MVPMATSSPISVYNTIHHKIEFQQLGNYVCYHDSLSLSLSLPAVSSPVDEEVFCISSSTLLCLANAVFNEFAILTFNSICGSSSLQEK